jgi:hypothetical protein
MEIGNIVAMTPSVVPVVRSRVVSCPRPAPFPRPRPCCDHGAGPGTCAFGDDVGAWLVVLRWHTCSESAASCAFSVALVFLRVSVIPFSVAAALARLEMASTVSCWNSVVAAFAMLNPAPTAVFFVSRYVSCALVKWIFRLFHPFSTRGRALHFYKCRLIHHC